MSMKMSDRECIAAFGCPFCEVGPGQRCVGPYGDPVDIHFTRILGAKGEIKTPVTTQAQLMIQLEARDVFRSTTTRD